MSGGTPDQPGSDRASSPASGVPDLKRLRWRTRRGTRELDALFGGWLETSFPTADAALQRAFDELLDVQDPDLWDWVMGHARPPRIDWQAIIDDIRARHRL
ncbi:succinate dehydrogenase assembly factor 2 [Dyella flagellata]